MTCPSGKAGLAKLTLPSWPGSLAGTARPSCTSAAHNPIMAPECESNSTSQPWLERVAKRSGLAGSNRARPAVVGGLLPSRSAANAA